MHVVGLDIGGANLKGASTSGEAFSEPFEIWRAPGDLAPRLMQLLSKFPRSDRLAVTMTAELADCFESKRIGVEAILRAVEEACAGTAVRVWATTCRFMSPEEARERPLDVAAANWHALATWSGRLSPKGEALLLDIGSTTTDLIRISDSLPCPTGLTDLGRLLSGELVYSGVRRTPVFAVAPSVPLRGGTCPLAAEWFATMLDVYLILGWTAEDSDDRSTANGRGATIECAFDRLARSICCDRTELTSSEVHAMAKFLAECQMKQLLTALQSVRARRAGNLVTAIVSGEGEFLARRVLAQDPEGGGCNIISMRSRVSPRVAEAACAYAVAMLAAEMS